jgi:hypothetical protein
VEKMARKAYSFPKYALKRGAADSIMLLALANQPPFLQQEESPLHREARL